MSNGELKQIPQTGGALSAEHYQTFEMAKENDDVLAGDDIAQIRSYAAYARAQAQAIHKTIAATSGIEDVAAIKAETTETAQTFAKVGIYADQRIGEILRSLEQAKRGPKVNSDVSEKTKADAIADAGIPKSQAYDLQKLAANPDVVQAVLDKAEAEGRIPSRKQVLDAIKERDSARADAETARSAGVKLKEQVESLRRQVQAKPQVVERDVVREVVPSDYEETKRRVSDLKRDNERLNREYQEMWKRKQELDRELRQANELLGEKERNNNAQRDVETLTMATNNYLRSYGGKAWAFDQFDRVDEVTQNEFCKAINSLAAFAQNLAQMVNEMK